MARNRVSIQVLGDSKDLQRAFKEAESSSRSFATNFQKDTQLLGQFAKRGALAIGALVATVVGVSLKGGVDRLMGLERANKQLEQLGVTGSAADGLMESLLDTLRGTPFALDKGATSLAGFVASGRDLADVPRLVQQVTDAAAFGNTTLEEMDFIWQRVQTSGRITNRELQMLSERNIPVYQQLAGALGITADEVRALAAAGELSADEFFDAWQAAADGTIENTVRIEGAAQALGDTTEGAFGNMRTAMSRFGATLLEEVFPMAKDFFNAIGEGFDRMGAVMKEAFGGLDTSGLEDFISRIPELMENAAEKVVELWQATETLRDVATTAFRGIAEVVTNQLAVALAAVLITLRAISRHPLIMAIMAVGWAIGTIAERSQEAWSELKELRDVLADVEGSADDARVAFEDLLTSEQIFMLNQYGLTTSDLANMSLPQLEQALADVEAQQRDSIQTDIDAQHAFHEVARILDFVIEGRREHAEAIGDERAALMDNIEAQHRAEIQANATKDATKEHTGALHDQVDAIDEVIAANQRATDPILRSLRAARELKEAQDAYNEALKEHGPASAEATEAAETLLGAQSNLDGALQQIVENGGPNWREEFRRVATQAGLAEESIEEMIAAVERADGMSSTVNVRAVVTAPNFTMRQLPTGEVVASRTGQTSFQHGGIVTGPTGALIGEAGDDEAVIPLNNEGIKILGAALREAMGGNGGINIVVHAGLGTNGHDVGEQIVEQIVRARRRGIAV